MYLNRAVLCQLSGAQAGEGGGVIFFNLIKTMQNVLLCLLILSERERRTGLMLSAYLEVLDCNGSLAQGLS